MSVQPIGHAFSLLQAGQSRGLAQLQSGAQSVVQGEVVEGALEMRQAETLVKATSKAIKALDESLGTLIDDLG